ncbi:unnamed protein product [Effrenium voratum]|nr:unnamed protein product [Effrenium voratum]
MRQLGDVLYSLAFARQASTRQACSFRRGMACIVSSMPMWRRWRRNANHCRPFVTVAGATAQELVGLHFFSDQNFKPVRDQFVASVVDKDIVLKETCVEDLNVVKQRTAGGVPVYQFKTKLLLKALEEAEAEEVLLISDVDIQFFREVMPFVHQGIAGRDICFQREFTKLGVNIGFVAVRRTTATMNFWHQVLKELPTGRHDQRIVNNLLYTEQVPDLRWSCFPPEIWASSQAFDSVGIPDGIALHHANWIIRDYEEGGADASNPAPKLQQLAEFRRAVLEDDAQTMQALVQRIRKDPDLESYHQRTFGELRYGPEWVALPSGHPARPGGARKRRRLNASSQSS